MAKTSSYRDTANLGFGDPPRALSAAPAVWGPPMDVSAGPDPAGGGGQSGGAPRSSPPSNRQDPAQGRVANFKLPIEAWRSYMPN